MSAARTLWRLGAAWLALAALAGCQGMTVRTDASEPTAASESTVTGPGAGSP